jgi:polyisoprenoid-binding protein YceI
MPLFRSLGFVFLVFAAGAWGAPAALRASELPVVVDQSHSRFLMQVKTDFSGFTAELSDYHIDVLADADSGKITSAQISFPFSAVKTCDLRRDRDMLVWENNDQFPQVVCTLTRLDPHGEAKFTAQSEVLFHGVKKTISFPVTVIINPNQTYVVDGEADIDTRDFNLPKVRKYLVITLNPVVHVVFHFQAALMKK